MLTLLDLVLTVCTCGLWLIVVAVRNSNYKRKTGKSFRKLNKEEQAYYRAEQSKLQQEQFHNMRKQALARKITKLEVKLMKARSEYEHM